MQILPGLGKAIQDLFSHDEALGLPKGSVRGIVFIILTAIIGTLAIKGVPIPNELAMGWSGAAGLYFGQKSGNGNGHPPAPA